MWLPDLLEPSERGLDECPIRQVLPGLLMRSDALIGDSERCQTVQHGECGSRIGSTVIEPVQDVAMEIDETHGWCCSPITGQVFEVIARKDRAC